MSSELQLDVRHHIQWRRRFVNAYEGSNLQVKLCDPCLSALRLNAVKALYKYSSFSFLSFTLRLTTFAETIRPVSSRGARGAPPISLDVNPSGTIYTSFDLRWSVIPSGCCTGLECSTATLSERAFSFRLPPRTEDRSVQVVIPWCDLTMYCDLYVRPSLSADLSPCSGCYKLILLTLYSGPAAAVR